MKPEPTDFVHDVSTGTIDTLTSVDRPRTTDSDLRLNRILEFEAQSLQKHDALEACLRAQNCGILRIGLHVEHALKVAVDRADDNLDEIIKLKPGFDIFGALTRQVEHYASLDLRLGESKRQAKRNPSGNRARRRNIAGQHRKIPKV